MVEWDYLEGANPYPPEVIKEYVDKGWWKNRTYGDILDRSAATYPDNIAVIDDRTQLTYVQLKEKVDRLAIALHERGVRKYDRLLIQLPNRHEFIVAFYAMHRIGAVPVLVIPRHEYREVAHLFRLTEPVGWFIPMEDGPRDFLPLIERMRSEAMSLKHLIIVEDEAPLDAGMLSMDGLIAGVDLRDYPHDYLQKLRPDPNDIALILPTGGTTGLPKGVPRTHNSYLAGVAVAQKSTKPNDVFGLATPIGHGLAQQGPVGSLMKGATLVLISVPRAKEIMETIQKYKITCMALVPTLLEDILNHPEVELYDLSSLENLVSTGASLRPETAKKAKAFFTGIGDGFKGNVFGSSEGPCATHYPDEPPEVFLQSIGRPMHEGDHWKVLDDREKELPLNTEGELAAKGPLIFTGYYKSEAENKQIFTKDGYYKMGDLGMINEAGNIFITGRKKDIIQRGGESVIPSEIEDLLHMHPGIEAAAVVGMPDPRLGEKACAYVTLRPGNNLSLEKVVDFLKDRGAGKLLMPERLEILDDLPRTLIGKVDKKALRRDIEKKLEGGGGRNSFETMKGEAK